MTKRAPKSSKKRRNKTKGKRNYSIVAVLFLVFVAVVSYLYYALSVSSARELVAIVNGEEITSEELDFWYGLTINPDFRDTITREEFLVSTLIPQKILLQEAEKERIDVAEEDVERLIGSYIVENNLTVEEFRQQLDSRGNTLDDVRISFEARASINELLKQKNAISSEKNLIDDLVDQNFKEFLESLMEISEIEIFEILKKDTEKSDLSGFEATGDKPCKGEKPILRLYTTSKCNVCVNSGKVFSSVVKDFVGGGMVDAFHWSLDTGDNLLTEKIENGVPEDEVAIFKKYSPDNLVPAVVLGCKYKRIGSFDDGGLRIVIKRLLGE